jgi:hypothetical protein
MLVKQVSIFVENKEGKIAQVLGILSKENINISALSLADTTNFGILRLIVDDPKKAKNILQGQDIIVKVNEVLTVGINDKPGGLAYVLDVLAKANVAIEYMYAFTGHNKEYATVVFKTNDIDKAYDCLKIKDIPLISAEEINQIW